MFESKGAQMNEAEVKGLMNNVPIPNDETIAAMEEVEKLLHDPQSKVFNSAEELFADLEAEDAED